MNIKEARSIVGKMIQWTMVSNGVEIDSTMDTITEDLLTLIKANRIVEKAQKRANERAAKAVNGVRKRKIKMTMSDRAIAAIYVAANFKGDTETIDPIAQHGNNIVVVLDKRFVNKTEEEE